MDAPPGPCRASRRRTQQNRGCHQAEYFRAGAYRPASDRGGVGAAEKSSSGANQDVSRRELRLEVCGPVEEQVAAVVRHGRLRKPGESQGVPRAKGLKPVSFAIGYVGAEAPTS